MKQETKLIKEILQQEFQGTKFYFKYKTARDYSYTSDILQITCDHSVDINKVIQTINKYVYCIGVYKKGMITSIYNDNYDAAIYSIKENKYIQCETLEFIEVRQQ
jgi:hypothetical protein